MSAPRESQSFDPEVADTHPLVATRALLEGRARELPSAAGARPANGALSTRALDVAAAIAEALFSREGRAPDAARIAWLRAEFGDFMARSGPLARVQFRLVLFAVAVLSPLVVGRVRPLRALPVALRVRALERLERSVAAPPLIALRALLCLIYYEHPDAAREVGIETRHPRDRNGTP